MKQLILIIDDSWSNKDSLERILKVRYNVMRASNFANAIDAIEDNGVELIFLNLSLPCSKDIIDFINFNKLSIPILFICASASILNVNTFMYDYVTPPFIPHLILNKVKNLFELVKCKKSLSTFEDELDKKMEVLRNAFSSTMCSLSEYRNIETINHVKRISLYTKSVLVFLSENIYDGEFTEKNINIASTASMLHDVGLIGISDEVLKQKSKFTQKEEGMFFKHTIIGCKIVEKMRNNNANSAFLNVSHDICKYHHERWDGSGYPNKCSGQDIPIYAQVVGLVDVYDELTSKQELLHEKAVNLIKSGGAGSFSPVLLETINLIPDELCYIKEQYSD